MRILATTAAVATFLLIVLGGVVRVTGSGLGCPDWPLCHGQIIPPLEGPILIEWTHRFVTSLVSLLIVATAVVAWRSHRKEAGIFILANLALGLLALQVVLGGITVLLELPPTVVTFHLATALTLFATLIILAVNAWYRGPAGDNARSLSREGERFFTWAAAATMAVFALTLSGSFVVGSGASAACLEWPLCHGELWPWGQNLVTDIHLTHRVAAAAVTIFMFLLAFQAWRVRSIWLREARLVGWVVLLFATQVVAGGVMVLAGFTPWLRALHLTLAAAVWGSLVLISTFLYRGLRSAETLGKRKQRLEGDSALAKAADILSLTKPRILGLLLFTTLVAMVLAAGGLPKISVLIFTMIGGAFAGAGASALNSYLDRDLDSLMSRTQKRPLPAGRMDTATAIALGIAWSTFAFLLLGLGVNALSALLALAGIIYYVLIYTVWLKRSTPQNVVIGGAAGAISPLVGWAAVTGRIELLPLILFAIVFLWTPPHSWALALWVKKDYQRAGVPMLPVVAGEQATIRQITLYTLPLIALTMFPSIIKATGPIYGIGALVLGSGLLYYVVRLWQDPGTAWAKGLYKYSTLYLALLLALMVVDRIVW